MNFYLSRRNILGFAAMTPVSLLAAPKLFAKQIGSSIPYQGLNEAAIEAMAEPQKTLWRTHVARAKKAALTDRETLFRERDGLATIPAPPKDGNGEATMPLNKDVAYYRSDEARMIASEIVSFQLPCGGWGKNQPRTGTLRQKGQSYVIDDKKYVTEIVPKDQFGKFAATIDNDATVLEIRFLGKIITANPQGHAPHLTLSLKNGLTYLLNAQYPHGGWPQVWPLEGSYHDAVTFNDNAIINVLDLLNDVAGNDQEFGFLDADIRQKCRHAFEVGLNLILGLQGQRENLALWAQQYDGLSLTPVAARNYEPAAYSSAESASIILWLMKIKKQRPAKQQALIFEAIDAGVEALKKCAIKNKVWKRDKTQPMGLFDQDGAPDLWARYYDLKNHKPIFGDRDKSIHEDISLISVERQTGYSWFNTIGQRAISAFEKMPKP